MKSCRLPLLGECRADVALRFTLGLILPRFSPRLVFGPEASDVVLGTTSALSSPGPQLTTPLGGVCYAEG